MTKELECYDGWTDIGIFIYFDSELTIEECQECMPPDENDENIIAYYFELPCEPICESMTPTEAPFTAAPTIQLESPSPSPSFSATAIPSNQPTDCYDKYDITESDIIEQTGANATFPEDAIKVISGEDTNVTIGKLRCERTFRRLYTASSLYRW